MNYSHPHSACIKLLSASKDKCSEYNMSIIPDILRYYHTDHKGFLTHLHERSVMRSTHLSFCLMPIISHSRWWMVIMCVCVCFFELYRVTDNDLNPLLHPMITGHFTFPRSALPVQPYHSLPLTVTHWCIMGLSLCASAVIAAHQYGQLNSH